MNENPYQSPTTELTDDPTGRFPTRRAAVLRGVKVGTVTGAIAGAAGGLAVIGFAYERLRSLLDLVLLSAVLTSATAVTTLGGAAVGAAMLGLVYARQEKR